MNVSLSGVVLYNGMRVGYSIHLAADSAAGLFDQYMEYTSVVWPEFDPAGTLEVLFYAPAVETDAGVVALTGFRFWPQHVLPESIFPPCPFARRFDRFPFPDHCDPAVMDRLDEMFGAAWAYIETSACDAGVKPKVIVGQQ